MNTARDSGKGGPRSFFALAFLACVVFCAIKIVPVYIDNYELQDFLRNLAVQATVQSPPMTAQAVQKEVLAKTESLGLDVERKDIKVSLNRTVRIDIKYLVYVDLGVYTLTLHFTPSAENSKIT